MGRETIRMAFIPHYSLLIGYAELKVPHFSPPLGEDGRGLLFFWKNHKIYDFFWTFHWKYVYLHCFQRGSRTDYSTAPLRLSRCTATTQALHPNDELSAPLLDDSVPCISNPPRPPPVLPEGRRMPSGCISIRFRFRYRFIFFSLCWQCLWHRPDDWLQTSSSSFWQGKPQVNLIFALAAFVGWC